MGRAKNKSRRKKSEQKSSDYSRKVDRIDPVNSIIIACEDTESSKVYLNLILDELKAKGKITQSSIAFAKHSNTHPSGVLEDLLNHQTKNGNTYNDYNHRWIVIDRDNQWQRGQGHKESDFVEALTAAENHQVDVAYSNDSFELWYLLHFDFYNSCMPRSDLNSRLIERCSQANINISDLSEDDLKSKNFAEKIYPIIKDNECEAIKRADRLLTQHDSSETLPKDANPSTTMHYLICLLRSIGTEKDEVICECSYDRSACCKQILDKND